MYIVVNGRRYSDARRVKTGAYVDFYAAGLENLYEAHGTIDSYEDDGTRIAQDSTASYRRQERTGCCLCLLEPVESGAQPVSYDEAASIANAVRLMLAAGDIPVTTDEAKITVSGLYEGWTSGSHTVGEIYNAGGQTWECYQAYDNAVYPDITPGNSAWYTFNRPLHGKSRETARDFVQPTGAHDTYKAGEWMIFEKNFWACQSDTAYSPTDYAQAWKNEGT